MNTDLHPYTARLRIDPRCAPYLPASDPGASVVVAGYHAAFGTHPCPAAVVGVFPGLDVAAVRTEWLVVMVLVRVEHATQVITPHGDGTSRTRWETNVFDGLPTGMRWYLAPAAIDGEGRLVIAGQQWSHGGRQAVLPRSVTMHAPGVPIVVDIHDQDPHTGKRWTPA
ncbi:hypothetical protein [Nocardia sp. NBC_01009]|uniref:hypothetical protein n=1 Tax=Nocardia sp. NBC_01009 TaxID=2975996 RepID=UPI003866573F|nr:hypothetical protein OHA42_17820 [Nocardia sp. NBC_01009]